MRAKLIVIDRLGRGGGGGSGEQAMNLQQVANGCEKEGDKAKRGSKAAAMRIRTISDIKKIATLLSHHHLLLCLSLTLVESLFLGFGLFVEPKSECQNKGMSKTSEQKQSEKKIWRTERKRI